MWCDGEKPLADIIETFHAYTAVARQPEVPSLGLGWLVNVRLL